MRHIFPSAAHFSHCGTYFQVRYICPSVAHISKCGPFFQVRHIFASAAHLSRCDPFFQVWPNFINCDPFLNLWRITQVRLFCPSVAQFSQCGAYFQVRHIFPSVARFSKYDPIFWNCDPFSQLTHFPSGAYIFKCGTLSTGTHFSKCGTLIQVWHIFSTRAHFSNCGKFQCYFSLPAAKHFKFAIRV